MAIVLGKHLQELEKLKLSMVLNLVKQGTVLFWKSSCVAMHCLPKPQFSIHITARGRGEQTWLVMLTLCSSRGRMDGREMAEVGDWNVGVTWLQEPSQRFAIFWFFPSGAWIPGKCTWRKSCGSQATSRPWGQVTHSSIMKQNEIGKHLSFSLQ